MTVFIIIVISSFASLIFMAFCVHVSTYWKRRYSCRYREMEESGSGSQQNSSCETLKCHNMGRELFMVKKECKSTGTGNKNLSLDS